MLLAEVGQHLEGGLGLILDLVAVGDENGVELRENRPVSGTAFAIHKSPPISERGLMSLSQQRPHKSLLSKPLFVAITLSYALPK